MLNRSTLGAGLLALVLGTQAAAQLPGMGLPNNRQQNPQRDSKMLIRRRSVSGVVKSLETERKWLTLAALRSGKTQEVPIDVGPSLIKAGPGSATFQDIKVGDKISVFGEVMVQGGLRAMEIELPKDRMTIPPPKSTKLTKEQKQAIKDAEREAAEAEKAEAAAAKKRRDEEEKAAEAARKSDRARRDAERKAQREQREAEKQAKAEEERQAREKAAAEKKAREDAKKAADAQKKSGVKVIEP